MRLLCKPVLAFNAEAQGRRVVQHAALPAPPSGELSPQATEGVARAEERSRRCKLVFELNTNQSPAVSQITPSVRCADSSPGRGAGHTSPRLCASALKSSIKPLAAIALALTAPTAHADSFLWAYNTQLVVASVTVLGMAAGVVGSFMLLRKQSLMGDALSHATLPGIAIAFLVMVAMGGSGKNLPGLLFGATVTGVLGVWTVNLLTKHTRLKDDAAMGVVLSVFFGLGIALLTIIQQMPQGSAAGLSSFIYGKTASMVQRDLYLILAVAVAVLVLSTLLLKELTLLAFDAPFAKVQGWPLGVLETLMLALVAAVTVVGLQAVGLILILAFLITPPAAARFWTENLKTMLVISGLIGAASGAIGAIVSAMHADMPAGAVVVLVTASLFVISMLIGAKRGVLWRGLGRRALNQKVNQQHLLRAMYELIEAQAGAATSQPQPVAYQSLLTHRTWPNSDLKKQVRRAERQGLVRKTVDDHVSLTDAGFHQAARVTRNHRLWEAYLIEHADIAPSHVDRDADMIEHVLSADLIRRLEAKLASALPGKAIPASPHAIGGSP